MSCTHVTRKNVISTGKQIMSLLLIIKVKQTFLIGKSHPSSKDKFIQVETNT